MNVANRSQREQVTETKMEAAYRTLCFSYHVWGALFAIPSKSGIRNGRTLWWSGQIERTGEEAGVGGCSWPGMLSGVAKCFRRQPPAWVFGGVCVRMSVWLVPSCCWCWGGRHLPAGIYHGAQGGENEIFRTHFTRGTDKELWPFFLKVGLTFLQTFYFTQHRNSREIWTPPTTTK